MRLLLSKYLWTTTGNISVTGFIREGQNYLRDYKLATYFEDVLTPGDLYEKLQRANGQFALIMNNDTELWIATDRLRTIPLYYCAGDSFTVSDSAYSLAEKSGILKLNKNAETAFLANGYTLNNLTLAEGIYQVEAGEMVVLNKDAARHFYHDIFKGEIKFRPFDICSEELYTVLTKVFESHFNALKDNFIALPLSGGYDSRLMACLCKKYHPENVICFTYGRKDNPEVAPAREVAKRLDLPWINIEYSPELINDFIDDPVFLRYYPYASELGSMFFMQDYFAVKYLRDNNIIPENTVFMPGHAGDFVAGKHLFPSLKNRITAECRLVDEILKRHSFLITLSEAERAIVRNQISQKTELTGSRSWSVYENWEIKERQSKFIVNSTNVFTFFEYQYVLPFWDKELIDFFNELSFDYKLNKKVYDHTLTKFFFGPAGINFTDETNPTAFQRRFQNIKDAIKRNLPSFMVSLLINHQSPVMYDKISEILILDKGKENFRIPHETNNYNSFLTQWYLMKIKEMIKEKMKQQ